MNRGVDERSDLYSLGVIYYEMLAGQRPFEAGDPMELIHAHLAILPEPLGLRVPELPAAVTAIVDKLLAKDAEERYQSAEGLALDLEACRRALLDGGQIEGFSAGQSDRQDLFQIHQKLYGREGDIAALVAAFESVLGGKREIVLVSGYSGIGKSSLVQEILKPLAREKGYYLSGKFDQYNRDMPYSAVIQAFDGLVRQLLTESEARIERHRTALLDALGPNAGVVCDVVPSLRYLLGKVPPAPTLGPVESQNRLNFCFSKVVSVFAKSSHPLALFLDDLQWIDSASLELLRTILADEALEAFFFCGAYRDNEVSPGHPFNRALTELKGAGLRVCDIVLLPLGRSQLLELLTDSLRRRDCEPLADAILKRTRGTLLREALHEVAPRERRALVRGRQGLPLGPREDRRARLQRQRGRPHGALDRAPAPRRAGGAQARRGHRQPLRPRDAQRGERVLVRRGLRAPRPRHRRGPRRSARLGISHRPR